MTKSFKALAFIVAFPVAGAALALDGVRLAADQPRIVQRQAAAGDRSMEAVCREVLVDTDEGYGVTNRESRYVCDEARQ